MAKDILYPLRRLHGLAHDALHRAKLRRQYRSRFRRLRRKDPKTVLLVMTPEHGNLGDHAIALAEILMLKRLGLDYAEVTGSQLALWESLGILDVMNGCPILITGGGNLGTLWMNVESMERAIITQNPKSPILILPNTIFYEDSPWGREEFETSRALYNSHERLYLYARERASYEVMRQAYRNVKLVPDMVLSLDHCGSETERHGCLLCLRGDPEKTRTDEQEQIIRKQAQELFGDAVRDTDTVEKHHIPADRREAALNEKFDEFSGAELVITDRLHGMIFCAVTGTPCIVINSKSPKVRGCYAWIRSLDYIRFADDVAQIAAEYRKIPETTHKYENSHLKHYYEELAQDILQLL